MMGHNILTLHEKNALVTGVSGTIGAAIMGALQRAGAKVAGQYRGAAPRCKAACLVQADLSAPGFEAALLDRVNADLGPVDILVNCAAMQDVAPLHDMTPAGFSSMQAVNVTAAFALSAEFARRLTAEQAQDAAIVNISSIEGSRPAQGHGAYATSKAALEMLTKSMALEYGASGLRVNAVAPGLIARPGITDAWPEGVERWENACPLGRMGQPDDIANAVVFLASGQAGFIHGTVLTIDGGMFAVPGW